ncbi:MAG: lipoyl synthase [bacterium]
MKKKSTIKSPYITEVKKILRKYNLHSVCESAHCPNIGDCFKKRTATFLILGNRCTRDCRFCDIKHDPSPPAPDSQEAFNLAEAVNELGLSYVVITSVTRDDLPNGGAENFAETVLEIRKINSNVNIEILTPDFNNTPDAIKIIAEAAPDVLNHNIETVPRLYEKVRPRADYKRSLDYLHSMKKEGLTTKSGIMTGLGENMDEIRSVIDDLRNVSCDIITIGQYFRPSFRHLPVIEDYSDEKFESLKEYALSAGFSEAFSGRFVRSSFNAEEIYNHVSEKETG